MRPPDLRNDNADGQVGVGTAAEQKLGGSEYQRITGIPTRQQLRVYLRFLQSTLRYHTEEAAKLPRQIEAIKAMLARGGAK